MRRSSVKEYVELMQERYRRAGRVERGHLLDEIVAVTGYHRKSATRLMSSNVRSSSQGKRRGRPRWYGPEVETALKEVWEMSDRLCGRRLTPFMGELVSRLQAWEALRLPQDVVEQLNMMSASTMDRLLRPYKTGGLRQPWTTRTSSGSQLKATIPIRTFGERGDPPPGFLEVDLVAHCGESTEGFYLNTLTGVDIATGWVHCRAVWGKGQERVGGAVHEMARALPFPILDLHSDNGGEFINHHLFAYCQQQGIRLSRSRPYKKNDNALVEQKNWAAVRRHVGYDRYSTRAALDRLQEVHQLAGLLHNFFLPTMKLLYKSRQGARVRKVYDTAKTPYQRLLALNVLSEEHKDSLHLQYRSLNPASLRNRLDKALQALWDTADPHPDHHLPVTSIMEQRPTAQ